MTCSSTPPVFVLIFFIVILLIQRTLDSAIPRWAKFIFIYRWMGAATEGAME
jgi:hypothetical protein